MPCRQARSGDWRVGLVLDTHKREMTSDTQGDTTVSRGALSAAPSRHRDLQPGVGGGKQYFKRTIAPGTMLSLFIDLLQQPYETGALGPSFQAETRRLTEVKFTSESEAPGV